MAIDVVFGDKISQKRLKEHCRSAVFSRKAVLFYKYCVLLRTLSEPMTEIQDKIQHDEAIVADPSSPKYLAPHQTEPLRLCAEHLKKIYGKRTVADDVNFHVDQGEIVGLLGPNGAGKTTSFYMTTGLVMPNEGRVFIGEEEVTNLPVYKRAKKGIGYLAQEASVFRKMSVEDNIMSVLELRKDCTEEYKHEKLETLIREFRLQHVRKNLGDRLSGGERRRTEIARCLAIDPKFVMLDEPFAGVDPIAVEDIQLIVWKLKRMNIGVLITDHKTNSFVLRPKDFEAMERERLEEDEREAAKEAAKAEAIATDTTNVEAETPSTEQETDNESNTITTES